MIKIESMLSNRALGDITRILTTAATSREEVVLNHGSSLEERATPTTVKLWINAFIPQEIPGLTAPAPGINQGKTMIHGPFPTSDCFLTDNRSFSSFINASSRMHSEIEIGTSGDTLVEVRQCHACDSTHEIDCEDGDVESTGRGNTSRMRFSNLRNISSNKFEVSIQGAANNPVVSGSPDIDFDGKFIVDLIARTITYDGYIDQFPAFEAYASINNGPGIAIFQALPLQGKTPWNLIGSANRYISTSARF